MSPGIREPIVLYDCPKGTKLVGVSSPDEDSAVITVNGLGVFKHRLDDLSNTNSLSAPGSVQFACPAVQAPDGTFYACLASPVQLLSWTDLCSLKDAHTVKTGFCKSVVSLLIAPKFPGVVVVGQDGQLVIFKRQKGTKDYCISTIQPAVTGKNKKVLFAELIWSFKSKDLRVLMILGDKSDKLSKLSTLCYTLNGIKDEYSGRSVERVLALPSSSPGKVATIAYQWPNSLHILASDGTWAIWDCGLGGKDCDNSSGKLMANIIGEISTFRQSKDRTVLMSQMNPTHVMFAGTEAGGTKIVLELWDNVYGVFKAQLALPDTSTDDSVTAVTCVTKNCALLANTNTVFVINVDVEKSKLVDALGKQSLSSPTAVNSIVKWDDNCKSVNEYAKSTQGMTKTIASLTEKLLDKKQTSTKATFQKTFDEAVALFDVTEHKKPIFHAPFVDAVFPRCLEETRFSTKEAILQMLRSKTVSASCYPEMILSFLGKENKEMLDACILHVANIPEHDMVRCLKHSIANPVPAEEAETLANKIAESHFQSTLRFCMGGTWAEGPLTEALRALTVHEATVLLKEIDGWLAQYLEHTHGVAGRGFYGRIPTLAQVIQWLSAICDAHFMSLILSSESQNVILSITQKAHSHMELCEDLTSVHGILSHYALSQSKKKLPKTATARVGAYAVEVLHI